MTDLNQHPVILQYIEWNTFGKTLGMDFYVHSPGVVTYRMLVQQRHLATPKAAHGGAVAALIDAALGVAALSAVCEQQKVVATVTLNVNFLSPAILGKELIAEAKVTRKGNRILFTETEVSDSDGNLVAKASATMNAYPMEKAMV